MSRLRSNEDTESSTSQLVGALSNLRKDLFNPSLNVCRVAKRGDEEEELEGDLGKDRQTRRSEITYFECGDRDTEIRAIAREIKRLILCEGYNLADIALVVRQRASYAETINRVMREELLPCNLESAIEANDIPAQPRGAQTLCDSRTSFSG